MIRTTPGTIVVIDDDIDHLRLLTTVVQQAGYRVRAFSESQGALESIERDPPDLVITDIFMPVIDGFEVLRHIQRIFPHLPVITMTDAFRGFAAYYLDISAKQGASMTFHKPIAALELIAGVERLIRSRDEGSQSCA